MDPGASHLVEVTIDVGRVCATAQPVPSFKKEDLVACIGETLRLARGLLRAEILDLAHRRCRGPYRQSSPRIRRRAQ